MSETYRGVMPLLAWTQTGSSEDKLASA